MSFGGFGGFGNQTQSGQQGFGFGGFGGSPQQQTDGGTGPPLGFGQPTTKGWSSGFGQPVERQATVGSGFNAAVNPTAESELSQNRLGTELYEDGFLKGYLSFLKWSTGSRLAAGSWDGSLCIWELKMCFGKIDSMGIAAKIPKFKLIMSHKFGKPILAGDWSGEDSLILAVDGKAVCLHSDCTKKIIGEHPGVNVVEALGCGISFTASPDGSVAVWDKEVQKNCGKLNSAVTTATALDESHVMVALSNGFIAVLNLTTLTLGDGIAPMLTSPLTALNINQKTKTAQRRVVVTTNGGRAGLFNITLENGVWIFLKDMKYKTPFACHRKDMGSGTKTVFPVHAAAVSASGKVLTAGGDGELRGWDVGKKSAIWEINNFNGLPMPVGNVTLNESLPNSEMIAYSCSEHSLLWVMAPQQSRRSRIFVTSLPTILMS